MKTCLFHISSSCNKFFDQIYKLTGRTDRLLHRSSLMIQNFTKQLATITQKAYSTAPRAPYSMVQLHPPFTMEIQGGVLYILTANHHMRCLLLTSNLLGTHRSFGTSQQFPEMKVTFM